jgi:hypothetical protein
MIQVTVRDQDAIQALEPQAGLHDLSLGAFPTVDQKAVFIMHHHLRRKPAPRRWCRGRCAKK